MCNTKTPEAEESKWNSAVVHLIIYTCAFPAATRQRVFREEKGLLSKVTLILERHVAVIFFFFCLSKVPCIHTRVFTYSD